VPADQTPADRAGSARPQGGFASELLGPEVVGRRVVVRRLVPGETGPTGGPAMSDVLGTVESWADGLVVVRREKGDLVEIPTSDIVAGKTVPPRPSTRLRVSPESAAARAALGWPAHHEEPLGEWRLREAGGYTKRANSALALGDPGLELPEALAAVARYYRSVRLTPRVRVIDGSEAQEAALAAGWSPDPDDAASDLMLGSVARARRSLGRGDPDDPELWLGGLDEAWLGSDERAVSYGDAAIRVLVSGSPVFARIGADPVVARGRAALCDADWLSVSSLWTHPFNRGSGLGRQVMRALLGWGAEHGASTVVLEVAHGNDRVRDWYAAMGLAVHHTYCYYVTA
jgi:ribosomal protein S18 acetylase RimI-like enzyme